MIAIFGLLNVWKLICAKEWLIPVLLSEDRGCNYLKFCFDSPAKLGRCVSCLFCTFSLSLFITQLNVALYTSRSHSVSITFVLYLSTPPNTWYDVVYHRLTAVIRVPPSGQHVNCRACAGPTGVVEMLQTTKRKVIHHTHTCTDVCEQKVTGDNYTFLKINPHI